MTTAQDGGKVVNHTHRAPLPPGNAPGTHFCWRLSRPQGHSANGRIMSMKIPLTYGIEPATFRFVAQHVKHCATGVPGRSYIWVVKWGKKFLNIVCNWRRVCHSEKVKIKCTLVQALRLCIDRTTHRGSRGIALLFLDHGTRRGWGVSVTPWPLFTPGKDPVPIVQEAGRTQGRSGQVRKISPPPGSDPRTVQLVASRYTYWATGPACHREAQD